MGTNKVSEKTNEQEKKLKEKQKHYELTNQNVYLCIWSVWKTLAKEVRRYLNAYFYASHMCED